MSSCSCSRTSACQSYGSYSSCANCGIEGTRPTWNSLDTCPTSQHMTQYTPDGRCDYQEKMSRNRYDWVQAFDYGTVQSCQGMNFGNNGTSCMYMGSLSPTNVSSPWGIPAGGVVDGATYIQGTTPRIGILDTERRAPYQMGDNACGYNSTYKSTNPYQTPYLLPTGNGRVTKDSQMCVR